MERERYCELIECNMVICFFSWSLIQNHFPHKMHRIDLPPLLSPPFFEMENIVPPKGGGRCTWSEDVQPPQEKLCLAAHGPHRQRLPEQGDCQGNLSLLRPHLAPSSHLRSGESYSRHCKVVDERVEVVGGLAKGADDDAVDSAKRAQLELHRPNCVPRAPPS